MHVRPQAYRSGAERQFDVDIEAEFVYLVAWSGSPGRGSVSEEVLRM